jgi:hypothetical protein
MVLPIERLSDHSPTRNYATMDTKILLAGQSKETLSLVDKFVSKVNGGLTELRREEEKPDVEFLLEVLSTKRLPLEAKRKDGWMVWFMSAVLRHYSRQHRDRLQPPADRAYKNDETICSILIQITNNLIRTNGAGACIVLAALKGNPHIHIL